jgi:hypothetical protein
VATARRARRLVRNFLDVLLRFLLPGSCRDQSSPRVGARRIRTVRRPLASATRPHLVAGASRRSSPSTVCASLLRHARVDESAARAREIFRTRRSSADATWRTKSARIVTLTLTCPAPCAPAPCAPAPCALRPSLCPAPYALRFSFLNTPTLVSSLSALFPNHLAVGSDESARRRERATEAALSA